MRGRNNNNRKGPNPLTRNYESNGPDVKIRGSAQQIAEKYAALARDAQSAGDRVMAENYLQHAEHYNRIIAAAQAQMPIQQFQSNRDDFDEDFDEERDDQQPPQENAGNQPVAAQSGENQPAYANGNSPQPVIDGTPAEVALNAEAMGNGNGGQPRGERQNGFHNNGHNNGEENFPRRNRRSRRGRGRQDFDQNGQPGEGESSAQADEGSVSELPQQLMQPIVRREKPSEARTDEAPAQEASGNEAPPASQE